MAALHATCHIDVNIDKAFFVFHLCCPVMHLLLYNATVVYFMGYTCNVNVNICTDA